MKATARTALALGVATIAVATPLHAVSAQQASAAEEKQAGDELDNPTIVVTATKRTTRFEDTPVAITVVDGEQLQEAGAFDTQAIQALVPSLTVTTSTSEVGGAAIRLRNVGTNANNFGIEPSVGVFVDGVYFNRSGIALNDLFDIENVQVLRGPQSTLFGKNTSAGAILINTRKPVFHWEGSASLTLGERDLALANAVVNVPVVEDTLALRFGGQYHLREGYMKDAITGADYQNRDRWLLRAQALWQPSPDLSIRLVADASQKQENCCAPTMIDVSGARTPLIRAIGGELNDPSDPYTTNLSFSPEASTEEYGGSLTVEWKQPFADLTFIGSYRDYAGFRVADADYGSLDIFRAPEQTLKSKLATAEIYLNGQAGPVDWLVGAFYLDETLDETGSTIFGEDAGLYFSQLVPARFQPLIASSYPVGGGQTQVDFFQDGQALSIYTHNVVNLTDSTQLTLGLRYSEDDKNGGGRFATTNNPSCGLPAALAALRLGCPVPDYDADYEEDNWSGTVALLQEITPDVSVFASYANGFKAGGINFERTGGASNNTVIGSEKSDSYEVGIRGAIPSVRANFSVIGFYTKFTDFQLNALDPVSGTFTFSNEGEVTSKGAEAELSVVPTAGLRLNASATYAHTRFADDVPNPTFAGNPPNNAPEWTATAGARYGWSFSDSLDGYISANMRWQSEHYTSASLDPVSLQEGYALASARAGVLVPDKNVELSIFVTNLFDQEYKLISFPTPQQPGNWSAFIGEPRTMGATLSVTF
tara:strand:- start:2424 stop:4715 length:2292 start_codon:yes stop_codon:yes gene_type:complete